MTTLKNLFVFFCCLVGGGLWPSFATAYAEEGGDMSGFYADLNMGYELFRTKADYQDFSGANTLHQQEKYMGDGVGARGGLGYFPKGLTSKTYAVGVEIFGGLSSNNGVKRNGAYTLGLHKKNNLGALVVGKYAAKPDVNFFVKAGVTNSSWDAEIKLAAGGRERTQKENYRLNGYRMEVGAEYQVKDNIWVTSGVAYTGYQSKNIEYKLSNGQAGAAYKVSPSTVEISVGVSYKF